MQVLNSNEIALVAGADAAATRGPGTNSWGETPGNSDPLANCLQDMRAFSGGGGNIFGAIYCYWRYH